MYKTTDTIVLTTSGRQEDIIYQIAVKQSEGYMSISKVLDSLYYEDYCGKENVESLKLMNNEKKYCYPI